VVPSSTYRLHFTPEFGFADATAIVPYLAELGIGTIYASPYLRARSGSRHGYDIVDHNSLNPEIGSRDEYDAFIEASQRHGLSHILDFVPNHMDVGSTTNPWWNDVLEWGERSPFAKFFDIDWHSERPKLEGRVLLPFLGDQYAQALDRGELGLEFDKESGKFAVRYFERRFPLAPPTYAPILERAGLKQLAESFASLDTRLLPIEEVEERAHVLQDRLRNLASQDHGVATRIASALAAWNVRDGDPAAAERLNKLIERQHYRLASWRVSLHEINYRRFFDINDLAGLRVEDADVLAESHRFVFQLLTEGKVQGLRIDHVDGLFDPGTYCRLLRERAAVLSQPLYLVVEKILARYELPRTDWGVDGTVGYDFLNAVNWLFVDPRAERAFDRIYGTFAPSEESYDTIAYQSQLHVAYNRLASELGSLTSMLYRIAQSDRRSADFTYEALRTTIASTVASFPIYRTYVTGEGAGIEDRRFIEWAVTLARKRSEMLGETIFDFVNDALTTDIARNGKYDRAETLHFAMRFQQYSSALAAKGIEDTAFYRYTRLLSLNEVGGDPNRFGATIAAFHRHNEQHASSFPHGILATATHDHKRGEDTRLRIDSLTEMPGRWRRTLRALSRITKRRAYVDSEPAPSRNDEYALYQMLVGTWPAEWIDRDPSQGELDAYVGRLQQWLVKSVREAKLHSNWVRPNVAYEDAATAFVRRLFEEPARSICVRELRSLLSDAAVVAMISSLSQTTLKLTSPGVPDVYQGCELWDLSMVDPDNRRTVDFELRKRLLDQIRSQLKVEKSAAVARDLLKSWHDGRVKLFVLWRLLQLRKARAQTFSNGRYRRLGTGGRHANRIVAFARDDVLIIAPRLVWRLLQRTRGIPAVHFESEYVALSAKLPRSYQNIFTGARVDADPKGARAFLSVADALKDFPVAALVPRHTG
jgi:(1->4)-alpha-D-glucan 1-alpha-D-glucosylmutase